MPSFASALRERAGQGPACLLTASCLLASFAINPPPAFAQQIEFQIRTPSLDDDYLTWAPAPARIRQVPAAEAVDKRVVLTNDPERLAPAGRKYPLDGNVAFARSVAPGATAAEETLELVLPKDGSWVELVVAGAFPRASTDDKDTIIEVHEDSANGPLIHTHATMVRIRKDHRELTDQERNRFLNALSKFHRELKGYERFVRIHELASMGKSQQPPNYWWPDLAHRGSGFLAWHRAYLLSFERELQKIDPAVALPYWKMDLLPSVFEENFMGANAVTTDAFVEPQFPATNPLAHWVVNGQPLYRFPLLRRDEHDLQARFFSDDMLFTEQTYFNFRRRQEANPHNVGHDWTGPWMQNCMISPSDPVFWPFHAGFDRQWAKWQWSVAGSSRTAAKTATPRTMPMTIARPAATSERPTPVFRSATTSKTPCGRGTVRLDQARASKATSHRLISRKGISGRAKPQPAVALGVPTPGPLALQASPALLEAGQVADIRSSAADPEALAGLATDKNQPAAQRIEALRTLSSLHDGTVVSAAIRALDEAGRSAALGTAAIEALSLQTMFGELDHATHHAVMATLHKSLSDKQLAVRQAALRILASHRDPMLIEKLAASLAKPGDTSFAPVDAIRALAVAGAARQYAASIRKHISDGESDVRAAAIVALASDAESRPTIAGILADPTQPEAVRSAAIRSLTAGGVEAVPLLSDGSHSILMTARSDITRLPNNSAWRQSAGTVRIACQCLEVGTRHQKNTID